MGKLQADLVITSKAAGELRGFLRNRASDGREAFAALLCGVHRTRRRARLLVRRVILPEDDCFVARTAGGISLRPEFDEVLLGIAEAERLVPVQVHTHPGRGVPRFSFTDDHSEASRSIALRKALQMDMGSVVFDSGVQYCDARLWRDGRPHRMRVMEELAVLGGAPGSGRVSDDGLFDRQVRAFGSHFQRLLQEMRIGIVGAGGLGSIVVDQLARLGVSDFVVVDPDRVERSNLNRLVGSTAQDARHGTAKTEVARRLVAGVHEGRSRVTMLETAVDDRRAIRALAPCDVLVVATDNHASRLLVQEIGVAYLRPVLHAGVGLEGENGRIRRVLGRATSAPTAGPWCLYCRGVIDPNRAARETADPEHRAVYVERGYLPGTPDPAVAWANGALASVAVSMLHDRVFPFRDGDGARDILLDLLGLEMLTIADGEVSEDCTVCGVNGLRGLGDGWLHDRSARAGGELRNLLEAVN